MFYICIKQTESEQEMVCICKAKSAKEANRMIGQDENSTQWISLTSDQLNVLVNANEGYIGKVL